MNNYIKPVIKLASVNADGSTVSCSTTANDLELIQAIVGPGIKIDDGCFGMNESCATKLPIDMYCKFTSTSVGALRIFWS